MKHYELNIQYLKKGDTAWWVNYFGYIEPVKVYEVQRMGPTPDYAVYYWIKPILLKSKIRTWVYSFVYSITEFLNKSFNTRRFEAIRDNRFVNRNFFWWPGHAVMIGDTIFETKEDLEISYERYRNSQV